MLCRRERCRSLDPQKGQINSLGTLEVRPCNVSARSLWPAPVMWSATMWKGVEIQPLSRQLTVLLRLVIPGEVSCADLSEMTVTPRFCSEWLRSTGGNRDALVQGLMPLRLRRCLVMWSKAPTKDLRKLGRNSSPDASFGSSGEGDQLQP